MTPPVVILSLIERCIPAALQAQPLFIAPPGKPTGDPFSKDIRSTRDYSSITAMGSEMH